jgi:hypothetical protein
MFVTARIRMDEMEWIDAIFGKAPAEATAA